MNPAQPMMNDVLILNADWTIDAVVSLQKAVSLMLDQKAYMLVQYGERLIRSTSMSLPFPAVLVHTRFVPRRRVRLSRGNVFARDAYTCQYCGCKPKSPAGRPLREALTWDHVVPRAQAKDGWVMLPWSGERVRVTSWKNLLTACERCNGRKGGRTPKEAKMTYRREPGPPTPSDMAWMTMFDRPIESEWAEYLPNESPWADYWTVELDSD